MNRDVEPRFKEPRVRKPYRGLARVSPKRAAEDRELWQSRRTVRERSGGWCEVPGCGSRAEHAHHVVPRAGGKPDHSPGNLIDLCRPHHDRAHAEPGWSRDMNLKRRRPLYEQEQR